jgi:hypothetical protein
MIAPRLRLRIRLARLGALFVGLALVWACNAPPIVVPPPAVGFTSELLTDATGTERTFWRARQPTPLARAADATFRLYNLDNDFGYIVTAEPDGTFVSQPMEGMMDDRISLYYITPAGDYSDSICLLLREATPVAPFCP